MSLRDWARALKQRCVVLMLAMQHPRTPWHARTVGALTLLYALSPIDLIPDFIPVIGHLDDLVLVPIGLWLTIKLVPKDVWAECEAEAARQASEKPPQDWRGAVLIVMLWLALLLLGIWVVRMFF